MGPDRASESRREERQQVASIEGQPRLLLRALAASGGSQSPSGPPAHRGKVGTKIQRLAPNRRRLILLGRLIRGRRLSWCSYSR
jgi:hypothetical protein